MNNDYVGSKQNPHLIFPQSKITIALVYKRAWQITSSINIRSTTVIACRVGGQTMN